MSASSAAIVLAVWCLGNSEPRGAPNARGSMVSDLQSWIKALSSSEVTAKGLQRRFGGRLESIPPNQFSLHLRSRGIAFAEIVLSEDHQPGARPSSVNLVLAEAADLRLGDLEGLLGAAAHVTELHRKPTARVEFERRASAPGIRLGARVELPPSGNAKVRSVKFLLDR